MLRVRFNNKNVSEITFKQHTMTISTTKKIECLYISIDDISTNLHISTTHNVEFIQYMYGN